MSGGTAAVQQVPVNNGSRLDADAPVKADRTPPAQVRPSAGSFGGGHESSVTIAPAVGKNDSPVLLADNRSAGKNTAPVNPELQKIFDENNAWLATHRASDGTPAAVPPAGNPASKVPYDLPLDSDGSIKGGIPQVISKSLEHNPGIFFGDEHGTNDVVDTFKEQIPALKAAGVKTLYVEWVLSKDQEAVLDKFQKDGDTVALKKYLLKIGWTQDNGDRTSPWLDHAVGMLAEARKSGFKIYGLGAGRDIPSTDTTAHNKHWAEVIKSHPPSGKYAVYGGASHAGDITGQSQGVHKMLGIPAIKPYTPRFAELYFPRINMRIDESGRPVVDPGKPRPTIAPGEIIYSPDPTTSGDFLYAPRSHVHPSSQ